MKLEEIKNKIKRELNYLNITLKNINKYLEYERIEHIANEKSDLLSEVFKLSKIEDIFCNIKFEEENEIAKHYTLEIIIFSKNITTASINLQLILFNWELNDF